MDDKRTAAYFDRLVRQNGTSPLSADWSGANTQEIRFDVLASAGISSGDCVLDIGCGQGWFYHFLRRRGIDISYTGVDLSQEMVRKASAADLCPNVICGSIECIKPRPPQFNWVVASGLFYLRQHEPYEFMRYMINAMFDRAARGIAFNTLIQTDMHRQDGNEFVPRRNRVEEICKSISDNVYIADDYHPADVTFFVYREN
jgi:cyclopropane fatty-acyl-phospholipid synthase-like methyltransferase